MEQAKWYRILILRGTLKEKLHYKVFRYLINQIIKRSVNKYASVWIMRIPLDKRIYIVHEFQVFCGKKKLNKLIEEAHLLGLEDELLIFERK